MTTPVRRLIATLFVSQSLATVGMTAAFTIGTIAASRLSGDARFAGLASTLFQVGVAIGAYPAARFMDRFGRRPGLSLGFVIGLLGALFAGASLLAQIFALLLFGYLLMGIGRGAADQSRFAAAEMVLPLQRARAVSWVVLGGTVGGILGPLSIGPASRLAVQWHFDDLIGPLAISAALFILGALLIVIFLRPDPRTLGHKLAAAQSPTHILRASARPFSELIAMPSIQLAVVAMVFAQIVMTTVMVITPLHMTEHQHTLDDVSIVISAHIVGMYGLSMVSGRVADRLGHNTGVLIGAFILITACLLAPFADSTLRLAGSLFLLGLGWNFCYVAGSSLLSDSLRPPEQGRVQGTNDFIVGATAAVGSLSSGLAFATIGYTGIAFAGISIALILVVFAAVRGRMVVRTAS